MAKIKEKIYKYKVGQIVYCRPFIFRGDGMSVYKCMITEMNHISGTPYYTLKCVDRNITLFVVYEGEMNIKPSKLVREAKKAINDRYEGYIRAFNDYIDDLSSLQ